MHGGLRVDDVAEVLATGGRYGRRVGGGASAEALPRGEGASHGDDAAGPATGPGLGDAAVVTQRELGWEQLWAHARELGRDPVFAGLDDREIEVALHTRAVEASAALARLFEVLAEFVVRGIWAEQGCRTPGAWLSWKLGIGASTAREWVRVAIRLRELPLIAERFAQGGLSYSKTRALTRIALPDTQTWLLQWADHATAAQLEHISRNLRGLQQARHAPADAADDDGWAVAVRSRPGGRAELRLEGPAEEIYELEARCRRHAERELAQQRAAGGSASAEADPDPDPDPDLGPDRDTRADDVPWATSAQLARAVATAVLAGTADNPPDTSGLDRHTLVLHTPADALAAPADADADLEGDAPLPVPVRDPTGRIRSLDRRVLRRLACDAGIVVAVTDGDGTPLDIGRRKRQVSAALRRAVLLRDRQSCRFPGCATTRHLHVHHIHHWADGGPTVRDNLITLCGHHHRFIHHCHGTGRPWHIELRPGGQHRFREHATVAPVPNAGPTPDVTAAIDDAGGPASPTTGIGSASAEAAATVRDLLDDPLGRPGPHAPLEWDGPGHYGLDLAVAVLQQHLDAVLPPTYLLAA